VVQSHNDVWYLPIDIGTQSPIECFVYNKLLDPGQTLENFLKLLRKDKVEVQSVSVATMTVIRDAPAIFVVGLYTTKGAAGRLVGELKLAFHAHETHPVACAHDELGYHKTFASVVESLVSSLQELAEPEAVKFEEISEVRLGDTIVGFDYGRMRLLPNG